jgi:glycerol kinase
VLPDIQDSAGEFGIASREHLGFDLPIRGVAGDQQAALVGQACFSPGMVKSTYGTGCFALLNTGTTPVPSRHRLLSTVAYQLGGVRHYALEGSIFCAGATVQWLRDGIGLVANAAETGLLAAEADPAQPVYLVPAFAGLGAPHWDSEARALLSGLTRGTTRREIARAALESVAFQTRDLVEAMRADAEGLAGSMSATVRVDGGMSVSDWTMQSVADIVGCRVDRPAVTETTALGAAFLAGWAAGLYPDPQTFQQSWRAERSFLPASDEATRERRYLGWRTALRRAQLAEAEPA